MNNLIKLDLSTGTSKTTTVKDEIVKKYLGGRGLGAYLYSKKPKRASDPENSVFIVPGLLTGTLFPSSSRTEVVTSSPLTSYYTASSAGGRFGAYLKHSGISALEITGKSRNWCYVVIQDQKAVFKSAKSLVGKSVFETQDILRKKFEGKNVSIAVIGQAGENLVKFSSLMFDKRAAGRTGTGWHFGFKKIKAIVVVESSSVLTPKDSDAAQNIMRGLYLKKIQEDTQRSTYCTPAITGWSNEVQTYPASNYRRNFVSDKEISKLDRDEYGKHKVGIEACWSCPLACTRIVKDGKSGYVKGPEYESIWSLGANCDNFDLDSVIDLNHLCDDFGMDTLSTGGVLGWYKECVDKGLVKDKWSSKRMRELISEIATKTGVGEKLADGVVVASKNFGFGQEFAVHSKGLELPAWDPRSAIGMSINYATSPTGGDHCKGWTIGEDTKDPKTQFLTKGKSANVIQKQDSSALIDSLGTCIFADFLYDTQIWSDIISAFFGWKIGSGELKNVGTAIFNMEYEINKKLGHPLSEDTLPERIIGYEIEVTGQKVTLTKPMFDEMMKDYIRIRGWKN